MSNINYKKEILDWIQIIVVAFIIAFFIKSFIFQNTKVIGQSMEPTLTHNNNIIVNKLVYIIGKPKQFDIVVFPYSKDKLYVKRIIGMPGDVVNFKDGLIYVNDKPLDEDYILEDMLKKGDISFPFTVSENNYFVMGDNRNNSSDSRYSDVGTIERKKIVGRADLRIWPINQIGLLK